MRGEGTFYLYVHPIDTPNVPGVFGATLVDELLDSVVLAQIKTQRTHRAIGGPKIFSKQEGPPGLSLSIFAGSMICYSSG